MNADIRTAIERVRKQGEDGGEWVLLTTEEMAQMHADATALADEVERHERQLAERIEELDRVLRHDGTREWQAFRNAFREAEAAFGELVQPSTCAPAAKAPQPVGWISNTPWLGGASQRALYRTQIDAEMIPVYLAPPDVEAMRDRAEKAEARVREVEAQLAAVDGKTVPAPHETATLANAVAKYAERVRQLTSELRSAHQQIARMAAVVEMARDNVACPPSFARAYKDADLTAALSTLDSASPAVRCVRGWMVRARDGDDGYWVVWDHDGPALHPSKRPATLIWTETEAKSDE